MKKEKKELSSKVKAKVDRIYKNFGLDTTLMEDEEGSLDSVYEFYNNNREKLESDLLESEQHAGKFENDELL
jgi:hypothetical protein